jgi:hypothetical protein
MCTVDGLSVTNDGDGNLLFSSVLGGFSWDERGHLEQSSTTVSGQTVGQTNFYDALGRRNALTQTIGSQTNPGSYVYDGLNVALAYNGSVGVGSLLGLDPDELFMLNFNEGTRQIRVILYAKRQRSPENGNNVGQ